MKIITVVGTRPEIIRLSLVLPKLDRLADHFLAHTGQNYDERLSAIFFKEFGLREPDAYLAVKAKTAGAQVGQILERCEALFVRHRPDRLLILGDTNSGLAAIVARRLGIPVYHVEAGNRCYDDRVPEEVNRRVIDHASSVLLPYTNRSRENLLAEGIPGRDIHVTGNPIHQVMNHFAGKIAASTVVKDLGLTEKGFLLVTMHRAENVDPEPRLQSLVAALTLLNHELNMPVVCSLHPRTRARMERLGTNPEPTGVRFLPPFGFFDFVRLEQSACCLLSDSGTVQEEGCLLGVPNVTLREVTERPETVDCGSNFLAGTDPQRILKAVKMVTSRQRSWQPPPEYLTEDVAETICRILLSYRPPDRAEQDWQSGQRLP